MLSFLFCLPNSTRVKFQLYYKTRHQKKSDLIVDSFFLSSYNKCDDDADNSLRQKHHPLQMRKESDKKQFQKCFSDHCNLRSESRSQVFDVGVEHGGKGSRCRRVKVGHFLAQQTEEKLGAIDSRHFFANQSPKRVGHISHDQIVNFSRLKHKTRTQNISQTCDSDKHGSDDSGICANVVWSVCVKNVEQLAENNRLFLLFCGQKTAYHPNNSGLTKAGKTTP